MGLKKFEIVFLALVATSGFLAISSAFDCSSLYFKETEGVLNYLANVSFVVPATTTTGWTIYFSFDRDFTGIGVWVGTIRTNETEGLAEMTNNTVNGEQTMGNRFYFRFRINWAEVVPAKNPPVLTSLRFGDIQLCQP